MQLGFFQKMGESIGGCAYEHLHVLWGTEVSVEEIEAKLLLE